MASLNVTVRGLEDLERIDRHMPEARRGFMKKGGEKLAEAVAESAPGGRGGTPGSAWESHVISAEEIAIANTRGSANARAAAKALEVGAYIRPGPGKRALRFRDGTFRAFARIPRLQYARKALRARRRVLEEEYARAYDHLER